MTALARNGQRRARRRSVGSAGVARMLSLLAFLPVASRIPDYARLIFALVLDQRMPRGRKVLLGIAAGYVVIGRDLISDDVPLIGGLDDVIVVVLAIDVFMDGVPADLLEEKLTELDLDRAAFHRDIAQIRRLTPGPVRRTIRRVPALISGVGDAIDQIGLGPRVRTWITKEDPIS